MHLSLEIIFPGSNWEAEQVFHSRRGKLHILILLYNPDHPTYFQVVSFALGCAVVLVFPTEEELCNTFPYKCHGNHQSSRPLLYTTEQPKTYFHAPNVGREHRIWADVDISGFGFRLEVVPLRFHLFYSQSRIKRLGKERSIIATQKHACKGKVRLTTYSSSIWSTSRDRETHRLP